MNESSVIPSLKQALLDRAKKLAQEYEAKAERAYQHILEDAHERLHIREQNEILSAQSAADRYYRRQIQSNELRLKAQLEQLRWQLIQSVFNRLPAQLQIMTEDQNHYRQLLKRLIEQAAHAIESDQLVIELNSADQKWLQLEWKTFEQNLDCCQSVELSPHILDCSGGVLIRDRDNRIRIDNTFEGRIERWQESIQLIIAQHLFQADTL